MKRKVYVSLNLVSLKNDVLFVRAWVAWVACWSGLRGWCACVGGVLAWMAWVVCLRGWCGWSANLVFMLLLLLLLSLKYYPEEKNVECLLF